MTCRHGADDPSCSSYRTPSERFTKLLGEAAELRKKHNLPDTPDASNFDVLDWSEYSGFEATNTPNYLVVKVQYPSCKDCAYEGIKVMVFENVTAKHLVRWKTIDPHFRAPVLLEKLTAAREAPSPVARFPGTDVGYEAAREWASTMSHKRGY
jgi:hypothetical protein